jgi:hypothetical protein
MSSKLRIPSPLRRFTNGQSEIEVDGNNVHQVLEQLFDAHYFHLPLFQIDHL